MICPSCGSEINEKVTFCPNCGGVVEEKKEESVTPVEKKEDVFVTPVQTQQPVQQPRPTQTASGDKSGFAIAGLVLGIVTMIAWLIMPLLCYIVGIVGIIMSAKGLKTSRKGMAVAGLVLSIIGIVLGMGMHCLATCVILAAMQ